MNIAGSFKGREWWVSPKIFVRWRGQTEVHEYSEDVEEKGWRDGRKERMGGDGGMLSLGCWPCGNERKGSHAG